MNAKRGYVPEDDNNFSSSAIEKMRTASRHITYLLNEGYDLKQASTFVGNHFILSERQRLALMRSVASKEQLTGRIQKQVPLEDLKGKEVWIDGFNTVITLEVIKSDSIVLTCMDGTVRDLAALRGTYRIIPETATAVKRMFDVLQEYGTGKVNVLLDQPVSNSGRLKVLMAETVEANSYSFDLDIQVLPDVDRELYQKELVVTSDSIILDHCISWINLTAECLKREEKQGIQVW